MDSPCAFEETMERPSFGPRIAGSMPSARMASIAGMISP